MGRRLRSGPHSEVALFVLATVLLDRLLSVEKDHVSPHGADDVLRMAAQNKMATACWTCCTASCS